MKPTAPARRRALPVLRYQPKEPGLLPIEVVRFEGRHPATGFGLHGHSFFELLYVERGAGVHRLGAEAHAVEAGQVVLMAPGAVHDAADLLKLEGALVLFESQALHRPGTPARLWAGSEAALLPFLAGGAPLTVPRPQRADFERRLQCLEAELAERAEGWVQAAQAELELMLLHLTRFARGRLSRIPAVQRPLMGEVFAFIERRFKLPISLRDVALAVRRSPAHLTTLVKAQTGRSVVQWINARRMAEARRLLLETEQSVEAVAQALGFVDVSYFTRRFRSEFHSTPAAFRRAHQR